MIRLAAPPMIPALRHIWRTCFGDGDAYLDFLFARVIPDPGQQVLVHLDESGTPQAMLCMRRAEIAAPGGKSCPGAYIFGVGTLPEARGRGLSTALLEAAGRMLGKYGVAASVLVPASEELFAFYRSRGYETAFTRKNALLGAGDIPTAAAPCVLVPARLGRMEELRARCFGSSALWLRWSADYLGAIDAECKLSGGEVVRFACAGQTGYAVCYRNGGAVAVKELAGADGAVLDSVLAALHKRLRGREYRLYLRADCNTNFSNKILPCAMIRWYDKKMRINPQAGAPAYVAHILD